jgi:hypothetical protein
LLGNELVVADVEEHDGAPYQDMDTERQGSSCASWLVVQCAAVDSCIAAKAYRYEDRSRKIGQETPPAEPLVFLA